MAGFANWLKEKNSINESIDPRVLRETGIGRCVSKTLLFTAQVHMWHLLAKSGQKHSALGSFYDALETEVDELAEKFIAIGGTLEDIDYQLIA